MPMAAITVRELSKYYGSTAAVDRVSLEVAPGELFFLLGPSGCGKTTLLRVLAGFLHPDQGEVSFDGQPVTDLPPRARGAGMVFQTYALWPHMTVAANVAYGLHVRGRPKAEVSQRVEQILKLVRLEGYGGRRPNQLSGGQQQRVALARALVIEPRVLLLDEPLSNLDARLRDEMRAEIRRIHQETGLTMVYVTHDRKEALTLADRVAVMDAGRLVQVGPPRAVYDRPANRFVAGFLGDSNFLPGVVREVNRTACVVETALGPVAGFAPDPPVAASAQVLCSIRPHAWTLATENQGPNRFVGRVEQVTFLGEVLELTVRAAAQTPIAVTALPQAAGRLQPGDAVTLSVVPDDVVILAEG
jgi:iron(III) transport system ATP-binding protein